MMPMCFYKRCTKPAEHFIGELLTDNYGESLESGIYLCEKHTKKIEKLLMTKIWRGKV